MSRSLESLESFGTINIVTGFDLGLDMKEKSTKKLDNFNMFKMSRSRLKLTFFDETYKPNTFLLLEESVRSDTKTKKKTFAPKKIRFRKSDRNRK